eukprot:TRINITY_DN43490_c0_g1_i1.p1 TRINITY_DN43490_c0_g1~~TRINITY_DN43490_c0_g1_i1.p1  ORF type:complete len:460 (+),score=48.71 TRINITY_DN43490_c0_g1_i1:137-1381(+)
MVVASGCWALYRRVRPYLLRESAIDHAWRSDVETARRHQTYPPAVPNTWYHLLDSKEVKPGKVHHVRCLGRSLAVWRTTDGKPVVMDSTCPHLGANLAVGGTVGADCITCPFHAWSFNSKGDVIDVPYLERDCQMPKAQVNTYPAQDWCGLLCVYFHADKDPKDSNSQPEFMLPAFVEDRIAGWRLLSEWNVGRVHLSPVDWVDQSGDHSHFMTLHNHFTVPWTTMRMPAWFDKVLTINHVCTTIMGDKAEQLFGKDLAQVGGRTDKHYTYFKDDASVVWKGNIVKASVANTLEMYIGPAIMCFHIPIHPSIGTVSTFVTTTPCEGGSLMKVRTYCSSRSWLKRFIAWLVSGVGASQLALDISIFENKIRLKKPNLVKNDGPFHRVNAWLKQFYSPSSALVGYNLEHSANPMGW